MKNKIKFFSILIYISFLLILSSVVNAVEELPDNGAKISSAQVIQTKTGTGPWDDNDEPGNDSSEDNNIVRSFDQVTWTVENTIVLNNNTSNSYTGGRIYFEVKLPEVFTSETIQWDLDSMKWIEGTKVSEDGLILTGYYQMNTQSITVPGKQSLFFVAKILGAKNGIEFSPEIKMWMNGNNIESYSTVIPDKTVISAYPKYNVKLVKNPQLSKRTTLDINGEKIEGRVHGYGIGLQLYNDSPSKGLKGVEYPNGEIKFEINSKLEKINIKNTKDIEDITSKCMPILYDYKINLQDIKGVLGNNMSFGKREEGYSFRNLPFGKISGNNSHKSVFNSGNVKMYQENEKIYVTIKDYKFNGVFPKYGGYEPQPGNPPYQDNIGFFSTIYFEIIIPFNEVNLDGNYNYYYTISDNNFSATSLSGTKTNIQKNTVDDTIRFQNVILNPGSYDDHTRVYDSHSPSNSIASPYSAGNAFVARGDTFRAWADTHADPLNEYENSLYTINKLVKFDGEAFYPTILNGRYFTTAHPEFSGNALEFKMWFVTKKDGTNWTSQQEMNNAQIEDLSLYENLDDIPENYICVGEYFENQKGYITNGYIVIYINLKVKNSAKIGSTYAITQVTRGWTESLDRNTYTAINSEVEWPQTTFNSSNRNYIKTEYDNSMNIISGTHNGGYFYGQSVLITGGDLFISKKAIDSITREEKVNYDFSKNEYSVHYLISPSLQSYIEDMDLSNVTLKVEDTLPKGVTYVPKSSNITEPEIVLNSDGTTHLIWFLGNINSKNNIPSIEYEAHLSEEFTNGKSIESKVRIDEVAYKDENGNSVYKLGNLPKTNNGNNQASASIQIINLSSHRLYKTMNTPVIEKNGEVHFTLSYKNNTDETISDFQLLDILPYNGDSRRTEFTGTYTLDRIVVTQEDSSGNKLSNDNLSILYTNNENARNVTSKDENLAFDWERIYSENVKRNATAIVVKGEVGPQGKVTVDIFLKTLDNKGADKYVNNATAQVYKATEEITTSNVVSQVVEREIEGIAWEDRNANGIKDEGEEVLKDIELTLTDELGNQVTDVNGNKISSVRTDSNGYYKFENLPKGNYFVRVLVPNLDYKLTLKEVGANSEINSKFNIEAKETDEITKLNSIDLPELTMSNVNVGFVKKATNIIVKHQTEEGKDLIEPEIVEGRIDEEYTTDKKEFEEYEIKIIPENANGKMKSEQIEVVYVYSLVKGKITITKVDKNDRSKVLSGAIFRIEKLDDIGDIDNTFIPVEKATGENGIAEFTDLIIGKYRVTEIKAPDGYELAKNTIEVEITKDLKEQNIIAEDRLKVLLPQTGGKGIYIFTISGIALMSMVLILKNKKLI